MLESDLVKLFSKSQYSLIFYEVSIGDKSIFGQNSTDRKIDIVIFHGIKSKKCLVYSDNKEMFLKILQENSDEIEIIEVKKKLNRGVIGQILVAEYMFKKKFQVKKLRKSVLCYIGDDALESFCKESKINFIKL